LHQKIRREISGGVFEAIFDRRPHPVVDILNFQPFVTPVTNLDATVNIVNLYYRIPLTIELEIEKQKVELDSTISFKVVNIVMNIKSFQNAISEILR